LVLICLRSDRVLFCPVCFRGMSKMRDDPPNYVFQVLRTGTPNKHPNLPTCRKPGGKSRWGCSMHSNTCSSLQAPPPPRLPKGVQAMTVCLTEVIPLTDVFSPTSVVVTEIPFACDTYIRLSFEDPIWDLTCPYFRRYCRTTPFDFLHGLLYHDHHESTHHSFM